MPIKPQSLQKIYRANRLLGGSNPIIVTTGDTIDQHLPFEEFYIFHKVPNITFLHRRTTNSAAEDLRPFDFGQFPETFSADALLASGLRHAQELLEFEISRTDRALHRELFWSAAPISYVESNDLPLIEFLLFGEFGHELSLMCKFTRSASIKQLCEKLSAIPKIAQYREPET